MTCIGRPANWLGLSGLYFCTLDLLHLQLIAQFNLTLPLVSISCPHPLSLLEKQLPWHGMGLA